MDWFEALTGFREKSYKETQSKLAVESGRLISRVNGRSWAIGEFAMVSLASTEHPHFVPSLAEAGEDFSGTQLHYSVDTVRYFRRVCHGDRLFFIIGADAFLDIPMWKEYETLLGLCDFIIANRPGIRPEALRLVIPPDLMARPDAKKEAEYPSQVVAHLHKTTIYLLENVSSDVSATDIRRNAQRGQSIHGLVSARVEEYILKQGLYR